MRFVDVKENISELEKSVKNKWRWQWLENENNSGTPFKVWCKKIYHPGVCFCIVCNQTIIYGSSGKKSLAEHANYPPHCIAVASFQKSYNLPGTASENSSKKLPLTDRVQDVKTVVGAFLAEHCLPYSISPHIIDLCKKLASDGEALNATTMGRTSATYTITHGIAEEMKKELSDSLKDKFFSLNIDEATNNAGNKFLNVLVQFFCEDQGKVVVDFLGSREVYVSTSENIFNALESILFERGLSWCQVISCLMDNCNVMRGIKNGVESLIRKVHMINNSAKAFFEPIEEFSDFQTFSSNIFYDMEDSPKSRAVFHKIQTVLYSKVWTIFRPIANRFLQMKEVADRLNKLWDALCVFYFGFLSTVEQAKYKLDMKEIYEKFNLTQNQQNILEDIILQMKKQSKTKAGAIRKENILLQLFHHKKRTLVIMQLYRGIINSFSKYVKVYQAEKPQCHRLHTDMYEQLKCFYSGFIEPGIIADPSKGMKHLALLDVTNRSIQVSDRQLSLGDFCLPVLKDCLRDKSKYHWVNDFFTAVRKGYVKAAEKMKKLPLLNSIIIQLSSLDPGLQKSTTTATALGKLAESLPNVIKKDQCGNLDTEIKMYTVDTVMTQLDADETSPDFQLDKDWWSKLIALKLNGETKYPFLGSLIKALLSVFSGPLVESTFNIMDDIIEDDRARMTHNNYEALAIIKSHLKTKGETAITMTVSQSMRNSVFSAKQRHQDFLTAKEKNTMTESVSSTNTEILHPPLTSSALALPSFAPTVPSFAPTVPSFAPTVPPLATSTVPSLGASSVATAVSTLPSAPAMKTSETSISSPGQNLGFRNLSRKRKHTEAPNTSITKFLKKM